MFAYIPARAGSKRVPGKNIRALGGRPVIVHVVERLAALPFIDTVYVSTEDAGIAAIATAAGAVWLGPRAAELADDKAGFIDLMHCDLPRHAAASGGERRVLFALSTAALVPGAVYEEAHRAFLADDPDILMAVVPYDKSPYWALVPRADGCLVPLFPDHVRVNSQDLPPAYGDAGLFYMLDIDRMAHFPSHKNVDRLRPFPVPREIAVDVDTPADWAALEALFEARDTARGRQGQDGR